MAMYQVGDTVTLESLPSDSYGGQLTLGHRYLVINSYDESVLVTNDHRQPWHINNKHLKQNKKESNMLESAKEYLKENKSIIMTIAVVLIVDHLVFGGAFREKVKSLVNGLLDKAQTDLDKK
jgi:hypothetical protein